MGEKISKKSGDDFAWHLPHPPEILVKLLETGEVPKGPAVDLGCGAGVSTSYISEHSFRPTIGLDIAFSAVCQARQLCQESGASASFVVAAAPLLPFQEGSCTFLFDRGCLQALPETTWPLYLQEVAQTLKLGGIFQLWAKDLPLSQLESIAPVSLKLFSVEQFLFEKKDGITEQITHAIFRKQ
jgi:SAM-dependent methyltransferase